MWRDVNSLECSSTCIRMETVPKQTQMVSKLYLISSSKICQVWFSHVSINFCYVLLRLTDKDLDFVVLELLCFIFKRLLR